LTISVSAIAGLVRTDGRSCSSASRAPKSATTPCTSPIAAPVALSDSRTAPNDIVALVAGAWLALRSILESDGATVAPESSQLLQLLQPFRSFCGF
jgi:hypothetical protein